MTLLRRRSQSSFMPAMVSGLVLVGVCQLQEMSSHLPLKRMPSKWLSLVRNCFSMVLSFLDQEFHLKKPTFSKPPKMQLLPKFSQLEISQCHPTMLPPMDIILQTEDSLMIEDPLLPHTTRDLIIQDLQVHLLE